ncbi:hypothetical protein, variant 2 [Aphanomyces invadans]|uniref:G-protein coupled receptors family 2 profile 2 domain-containing protein n=1 Tax=Aphanomyces invadans TaxID=157072 RepID=A0A024TZB0_9STRA|nr:hypothetical protein, variant 1 [Aphanomyces invadans]XP_008871875.1 hypothetical protein, variant 2 [Aphanomyces invadans]ETV99318.1 hypothetical protein, variant 1 [Aphanomyces invadans]ETV99319.1 hypothetical protein, variant 2 [Aphanomyces invadans]|eukprot:XP_008871874.1 hypothetical protein, variant 1 [Aphanomyces invadans]
MPLSTSEILVAVSASLSVCACVAMVVCFFVFEESRRCGRRLLFCLHVTDLIGSLAWLLTLLPCIAAPPLHSTIPLLCFVQGYMLLFCSLSSYLWTSCFAFHLYQIMWKQNKTPEMYELRYLLVAWGVPSMVLVSFGVQHACGFVLLGFGGLPWCWIRSWSGREWSVDGFMLQMAFFYGPVACAALFNTSMFVFLASKLGSASAVMSTAMENKVRRRMMGYISIFLLTSVWGALGRTFQVCHERFPPLVAHAVLGHISWP